MNLRVRRLSFPRRLLILLTKARSRRKMGKKQLVNNVLESAKEKLIAMTKDFSCETAISWLRLKFPSFETKQKGAIALVGKNEQDYFLSAKRLGCVTKLPDGKGADAVNKPLLVAVVTMKGFITERTSRSVQFHFAKRVLRDAVNYGATGLSGLPSQGLFFFHDRNGNFRLSLVTGEVKGNRFQFNEAKRQSFYIEPGANNNIVRRRFYEDIKTFSDLKDVFSVEKLTKEFYQRLFGWYTWAMDSKARIHFPNDLADRTNDLQYNNEAVIRLITRLMFTWFIRQKNLVPSALFDKDALSKILRRFNPDSMDEDNYYRAILQNLFFATFNTPQDGEGKIRRRWINIDKSGNGRGLSGDYGVATVYRYEKEFRNSGEFLAMMKKVPFLNCALFDCLDKIEDKEDGGRRLYFDGFSTKKERQAHIPNGLFFGNGDEGRLGIITLFSEYEFTIDENDADDADVSLDPELLGKVFENLLGAFNPETQETARKATGSFYTPREIVDYMVEESLKSYLRGKLSGVGDLDAKLENLFDKAKTAQREPTGFSREEERAILDALYAAKIIDPACGSGAFPMGVLHCMIRLMKRLDPDNLSIRAHLLSRYKADKAASDPTETAEERQDRLAELERRLEEGQHYPDYERKLYLIENCIYGVDIQPIAAQISKLRFFISLLCDQFRTSYDLEKENYGLLSLPNLEAKFVCANTLISLPDTGSELDLTVGEVKKLREDLAGNRHRIFGARSTKTKGKYKARDREIRRAIKTAVFNGLANPDEDKITFFETQIERARIRRKAAEKPDWQTVEKPVQQDFFAATTVQPMLIKIDRNADKREEIDREIGRLEEEIAKERSKVSQTNLSAAQEYANLVAGWDPFDQNASSSFFDPKWMFNISDGFDVVIGKPPYFVIKNDNPCKVQYETEWKVLQSGRVNIYQLFFGFAEKTLKRSGCVSYIHPKTLLGDSYLSATRKFMLENFKEVLIVNIANRHDTFEAILQSVVVSLWAVTPVLGKCRVTEITDKTAIAGLHYTNVTLDDLITDDGRILVAPNRQTYSIIGKIKTTSTKGFTFHTGSIEWNKYKEYLASEPDSNNVQLLFGENVQRYRLVSSRKRASCSFLHISSLPMLKSPVLVTQRTTAVEQPWRIIATYIDPMKETNSFVSENSINVFTVASERQGKFYLALLCSRFMDYYFRVFNSNTHVSSGELNSLPIPTATLAQQKPIISLVDRILAAKKKDPQADTSELEAQIDKLVYALYGLTEEEIAVVEGQKEEGKNGKAGIPAPSASHQGGAARIRPLPKNTRPRRRDNDEDEMLD